MRYYSFLRLQRSFVVTYALLRLWYSLHFLASLGVAINSAFFTSFNVCACSSMLFSTANWCLCIMSALMRFFGVVCASACFVCARCCGIWRILPCFFEFSLFFLLLFLYYFVFANVFCCRLSSFWWPVRSMAWSECFGEVYLTEGWDSWRLLFHVHAKFCLVSPGLTELSIVWIAFLRVFRSCSSPWFLRTCQDLNGYRRWETLSCTFTP